MKLAPIQSVEFNRRLETIPVLTTQFPTNLTSKVLKIIPELPKELHHVKRIKNNKLFNILILGYPDFDTTVLNAIEFDFEFTLQDVPKHKAVTKAQHTEWTKTWPITFHSSEKYKPSN